MILSNLDTTVHLIQFVIIVNHIGIDIAIVIMVYAMIHIKLHML